MDIGAFSEAATRKVSKASATDFIGGGDVTSVFSVNVSGGATDSQIAAKSIIASNEAEINRIHGYKVRLTPSDNEQLRKIQEKVVVINEKASNATATDFDLEKRSNLLDEADRILGKPVADVDADSVLSDLSDKINDLLAPKLNPADTRRIKVLETLQQSYEDQIERSPDNKRPQFQLQNVLRQIQSIKPSRDINQLSDSEQREYNDLTEQINEHVGAKLILNTRDSIKVASLQATITELQSQLPADTSGGPSPADVARAYTRLA